MQCRCNSESYKISEEGGGGMAGEGLGADQMPKEDEATTASEQKGDEEAGVIFILEKASLEAAKVGKVGPLCWQSLVR
jgi:hypothetical protein